jgi:SAM-dependent methyltransferase
LPAGRCLPPDAPVTSPDPKPDPLGAAGYGSGANPDLLARIPLEASLVVDVGCGAGALGAAYRRRNPAARVEGIEPEPSLAARAEAVLHAVHRLDVETAPLPYASGSLDCLIFGDALEHLRDPWAVLARAAPLLKPEGVLLACVPNVEHWRFAERLLRGGWRYEPMGLFDRTHLRWFSRDTMLQALRDARLTPVDATPRVFEHEAFSGFLAAIRPALSALGVEERAYATRALPLQFVWRATPRPVAPLLLTARTLRPVGGVNDVRIHLPFAAMATRPGVMTMAAEQPRLPDVAPGLPRVHILQRRLLDTPESVLLIRALRARGEVIVAEFDDDPAHWPSIAQNNHLAFRGVHAVQTSTPALAELLGQWNPEVAVFPNALDELPEPANFRDPERLTLFFGALNREADVAPFLPALDAVLAEAGGRLQVEVLHDRASFERLRSPHKRFTPISAYPEYRALMGRCEIAFLPLSDTRFNRMKSDLKFLEAAGHRLVPIASPTVYGASIRGGETGLIVQTPEDLLRVLRSLLADPARARAIAEAARRHVAQSRMLAAQVAPRLAWYRDLWARREALDAALLERVPEAAGQG